MIVLWMGGGMAQTETFDPKRYTPYAPGTPSNQVLSTFKLIDTVVDNIRLTEGLENIAQVMDRGDGDLLAWPAPCWCFNRWRAWCCAVPGSRAGAG